MAEYISFQPRDFFSTKLYTGTGAELANTGVGFQPDFVWIKERSGTESYSLSTSVQGATYYLQSNTTSAQGTDAQGLKSFDSDGFTVGTSDQVNTNTETYVSWNWKCGTTSGIATNGSTTITPSTYSFNQTAGISIIEYTGNATAGAKVAHGLGAIPQVVFCKIVTPYTGDDWTTYNHILGNTKNIPLNATNAAGTSTTRWNDTSPDSVNITLGTDSSVNQSGGTQIAYCFTEKKGFSKFGSYEGNDNADGPFVYTGFRPALVVIKAIDTTGPWVVVDDKRIESGSNYDNAVLFWDANTAEQTSNENHSLNLLSNGFKLTSADDWTNDPETYVYMAFAEFPIVSSNDVPVVAR